MKKTTLFILIAFGVFVIYSLTTVFLNLISVTQNNKNFKLDYVKKTIDLEPSDSLIVGNYLNGQIQELYTSRFKDGSYLSYISFNDNSVLVIRKLKKQLKDLKKIKIDLNKETETNDLIGYDIEEVFPFNYRIDMDRANTYINRIVVSDENVSLLKQDENEILMTGMLSEMSFNSTKTKVHEYLNLQDETFYSKAKNSNILVVNKLKNTYLYLVVFDKKRDIANKLMSKLRN